MNAIDAVQQLLPMAGQEVRSLYNADAFKKAGIPGSLQSKTVNGMAAIVDRMRVYEARIGGGVNMQPLQQSITALRQHVKRTGDVALQQIVFNRRANIRDPAIVEQAFPNMTIAFDTFRALVNHAIKMAGTRADLDQVKHLNQATPLVEALNQNDKRQILKTAGHVIGNHALERLREILGFSSSKAAARVRMRRVFGTTNRNTLRDKLFAQIMADPGLRNKNAIRKYILRLGGGIDALSTNRTRARNNARNNLRNNPRNARSRPNTRNFSMY
jgi:hypothetical protein